MKEKIISIILLFSVMAFLPFTAAKCESNKKSEPAMSTSDTPQKNEVISENNEDTDKIICGLTAALYTDDCNSEAIKAIAILMNTSYKANPESFNLDDRAVCLYKEQADNSTKEVYNQIEDIVYSARELFLCYNNEIVYIPYAICSNGNTYADEKYPYLSPVASPWDCFSKNYTEDECAGISIDGIKYLCQNGMSAEEALKWYLENFDIK